MPRAFHSSGRSAVYTSSCVYIRQLRPAPSCTSMPPWLATFSGARRVNKQRLRARARTSRAKQAPRPGSSALSAGTKPTSTTRSRRSARRMPRGAALMKGAATEVEDGSVAEDVDGEEPHVAPGVLQPLELAAAPQAAKQLGMQIREQRALDRLLNDARRRRGLQRQLASQGWVLHQLPRPRQQVAVREQDGDLALEAVQRAGRNGQVGRRPAAALGGLILERGDIRRELGCVDLGRGGVAARDACVRGGRRARRVERPRCYLPGDLRFVGPSGARPYIIAATGGGRVAARPARGCGRQ
ncbi:MAG: hypothetical protein J3K34DRAFT_447286 [Monoraphidium minutum]|nr:MAG: hypothetical protein J3K34DRAFT_447286 [Monoraphidium minutum]